MSIPWSIQIHLNIWSGEKLKEFILSIIIIDILVHEWCYIELRFNNLYLCFERKLDNSTIIERRGEAIL